MFRREENLFRKVKRRIFPPAVVMIFIKAVDAALLEIAFQVEHLPDPALRNGNIRERSRNPCRAGKMLVARMRSPSSCAIFASLEK